MADHILSYTLERDEGEVELELLFDYERAHVLGRPEHREPGSISHLCIWPLLSPPPSERELDRIYDHIESEMCP